MWPVAQDLWPRRHHLRRCFPSYMTQVKKRKPLPRLFQPPLVLLQAKGFRHVHGLDGSQGMLEHARHKGLYEVLKLCLLGQEVLPAPEGCYDATVIVGALSEGQVPSGVIPQLLLVTKPGGYVCLTTRNNMSNLRYKTELQRLLDELEQQGLWEKVGMQEVEKWERATSEEESGQDSEYISGVIYLYRRK
ncbi:methyltransferase-like protein 27 isoform 2-T3 [Liasis olivaceus]